MRAPAGFWLQPQGPRRHLLGARAPSQLLSLGDGCFSVQYQEHSDMVHQRYLVDNDSTAQNTIKNWLDKCATYPPHSGYFKRPIPPLVNSGGIKVSMSCLFAQMRSKMESQLALDQQYLYKMGPLFSDELRQTVNHHKELVNFLRFLCF